MSLLIEKQSTNFCLYSHKPKYQYIDDQYAEHYIVSLHGGGLLFVTNDSLWKFWKWQRVKHKHPVIIDANFHLLPFGAKCVQVEEGHFVTSYIPTDSTPVIRLADKLIIEFDQNNDSIKHEYEQEILRLRAELLSLQAKYDDLQSRYIWEQLWKHVDTKKIQKLIDDGYHRLPLHCSTLSLSKALAYMSDKCSSKNIVYEVHDRRKQYYEKKLELEGLIGEIEPNKVFYETHKYFDSLVYKNWDDIRNRMKKIKARLKL